MLMLWCCLCVMQVDLREEDIMTIVSTLIYDGRVDQVRSAGGYDPLCSIMWWCYCQKGLGWQRVGMCQEAVERGDAVASAHGGTTHVGMYTCN